MTLLDDIRGARTLGQAVPPYLDTGAPEKTAPTFDDIWVVTDERCPTCAWESVCQKDRTCWHENKRRRGNPQARVELPQPGLEGAT